MSESLKRGCNSFFFCFFASLGLALWCRREPPTFVLTHSFQSRIVTPLACMLVCDLPGSEQGLVVWRCLEYSVTGLGFRALRLNPLQVLQWGLCREGRFESHEFVTEAVDPRQNIHAPT